MSDALLRSDIEAWLHDHQGRDRAKPRADLLAFLRLQGHSIDDRQMRRACSEIDKCGSSARGYFWIVDAEDRRVAERSLHSRAMSELVRERRVKDSAASGTQGELF